MIEGRAPLLRPATVDEVPRLKELGAVGWETTYSEFVSPANRASYLAGSFWSLERLRDIVADDANLTLVAEVDGTIGGFLTIEPIDAGVVDLTRFYVDPAYRGSGVGAALFEAGVEWSRERGARLMLVNVFADNHGGRRFYERSGFTLTRLEPYTIGDQIVGDAWYEREVTGER